MVRTFWIAASLLTATLTAAGREPVESKTDSSARTVERLITIQEANRPAQICRIVQTWVMPNGFKAHDMQAVGSGARLTVMECGPADSKTPAGQRAVATQIFHWTEGKRPVSCPAPSMSASVRSPAAPVVASSQTRPAPVRKSSEIQRVSAVEKIAAPAAQPTPNAEKIPAPEESPAGQGHSGAAPCESCEEDCRPGRRPSLLNSIRRRRVECVECPTTEVHPCPTPAAKACTAPVAKACPAPVTHACPPAGPHVVKPLAPVSVHAPGLTVCDDTCEEAPKRKLLPRLHKKKEHLCVSEEPYPHGAPKAVKVAGEDTRVNMPTEPPVKAGTTWDKPKLLDRLRRDKKCDDVCKTECKPVEEPKPYMPPADDKTIKAIEPAPAPVPTTDLRESWGKPVSEPVKPVETAVKPVETAVKPVETAVQTATPRLPEPETLKQSPDPLMNPDRYQPPAGVEPLPAPAAKPAGEPVPGCDVPLCSKECRPGRRPNLIGVMKRMKDGKGEDGKYGKYGKYGKAADNGFAPPNMPVVPYTGAVPNVSEPAAAVPYGPPPGPPNPNQNVFRGQPNCTPPSGAKNAFTVPGIVQPVPAETYVGNQSVNAFSGPDGPFVPGGALAGPPPCCPPGMGPCPSPGPGLGTLTDAHFVPAQGFMRPGQPMPGTMPGNQTPTLPAPTPGGPAPTLPNPTPGQPMTPMVQSPAPQSETAAQLLQMLKASDFPSQREWAADQLAGMGGQDAAVTAGLLEAAKRDPAPLVRTGSIRALVDLSARDATVVAALQELHRDNEPLVRDAAAQALATFGAPVMPASPIQPVSGQMPEQH